MTPDGIDQVVLVGGSTRIPIVSDLVEEVMGKPPVESVNPDEAVALGAALQAGVVKGVVKDVVLLDVVSMSLGIVVEGDMMARLIERNSPIPIDQSQVFSTAVDNQSTVEIVVVQGERELATENKILGRFVLTGIDPAPSGQPLIKVTFSVTVDGTLSVSAKDQKSGATKSVTIEGASTLTKEEIEAMLASAEKNAARDTEDIRKGVLMAGALGVTGKLSGTPGDGEETKSLLRDLENARKAGDFDLMEDLLLRLCGMYPEAGILPSSYLAGRSAS
jgi:molecular chaperone DnaK